MKIKIALAGNPNSGKTTLFNALTGMNQYVGNWPGVTVEKKEGSLKGYSDVTIQDLPGIYSLSPYSPEEVVTRTYLVNEHPDAILNIVDGTNIERNLYLTTQLIELGYPVVVAVNMIDLVRKNGDVIDLEKLSKALGCVCMEISALKGEGGMEVAEKAVELAKNHVHGPRPHVFNGSVEHALAHIEEEIDETVDATYLRWYAIKLFERDEVVQKELNLGKDVLEHLEKHIVDCETEMDDDAESIIADQRYTYIGNVIAKAVKKKAAKHSLSLSDKVDRIVTNRILALPIFAGVMFLMYAIAMGSFPFSIGTMGTDWANDVLFGEWVPNLFDKILSTLGVSGWVYGLVMDGIVAGVGAVLGFVPQILVLSLLLSMLEDIGYMSRAAVMFFNYCSAVLRAVGDSKTPLVAMIVASVANIALDALAVFWLEWDIAGAAGATVVAQCLAGSICAGKILRTEALHFSHQDMKPQWALSKDLLLIGSPVAAKNIIIALGGMVVQTVVNAFPMSFIAGFTATNKLYGLLEIAATSYGYAVTTYVGQNYGAMAIKRIQSGIRAATSLAIATSLVIGALMLVFGRPITMIFISREDPLLAAEAGEIAYRYLCCMSISLPVLYLLYVYQSGLQGVGNTVVPMVSGILEFALRVSLSVAVAATGWRYGIFGAEVSAWWGAAIFLMLGYFRTYRKLKKNIPNA